MRHFALWSLLFVIPCAAFASDVSYEMTWTDCLKALRDTASQANIPLSYSVNTPTRKDFIIHTDEGVLVMRCQRQQDPEMDGLLTVSAPGATSVAPYVEEGYRRAKP